MVPFMDEINEEIDHLCTLKFTDDEISFLKTIPYFSNGFIEFLRILQLNRSFIKVFVENEELCIETNGPWLHTTWFEIYVLSIVQEVYTRSTYPDIDYKESLSILDEKISSAREFHKKMNLNFADFGTRRRFNFEWQSTVVRSLKDKLATNNFVGTSNVLLAKEYGLKALGTFAHEYLQGGQAQDECTLVNSQKYMLQTWADVYRGDLGIALSDVVGFDAFLRDFDKYFCKLFDGCRHDSGDPFVWCEKLIDHYNKMKINPTTKTALFSDGLTFPLVFELQKTFRNRIGLSYGIGTNLTNDMGSGYKALQLVMKMVECNGKPVAKVSDSAGKGMCEDPEFLSYLKKVYKIQG